MGGGGMRERKYTWPTTLNGKERKKEQNKLASRRFRQRRKLEMNHCDHEANRLETHNRKLREKCDELDSKIKLLKDLINKNNSSNPNNATATNIVVNSPNRSSTTLVAAATAVKAELPLPE